MRTIVLATLLPVLAVLGQEADVTTSPDPIAALLARLTPEGRDRLIAVGTPLDQLRPDGHELARAFLKPLAGGRGALSEEQIRYETVERVGRTRWLADRVLEHKVSLLGGYEQQDLGDPIDWFRAPEEDWQWPTHLSRHYWLEPAAYIYRLTADDKYADKVTAILLDWTARFPNGVDTLQSYGRREDRQTVEGTFKGYVDGPWTSLSAHARLEEWSILFELLHDAPAMTNQATATLLNSLLGEHRVNMLEFPRAMNQFQGVATSLVHMGFWYPGFEGVAEAEAEGWRRVERWATTEIYLDGSLAECSPNYGGGCVKRLHSLVGEAREHGRTPSEVLEQRIALATRYLALFSDPEGRSPRIAKGGGSVLGLVETLNVAGDPEARYVASRGAEGDEPALNYLWPWAGHAVIRSGWDPKATWLFFDAGPRGSGHHDIAFLGVQLQSNGHPLLCDPGYYTYSNAGEPGRMGAWLHSTSAHNTATVDGRPQRVGHRGPNTEPGEYRFEETETTVTAAATFADGYGKDEPVAVTHERTIVYDKAADAFRIEDGFTGEGDHRIDLYWQLPPQATVTVADNSATSAVESTTLDLTFESETALSLESFSGSKDPLAGWFSAGYGKLEPATTLRVTVEAALPLTIVTHLRITRR